MKTDTPPDSQIRPTPINPEINPTPPDSQFRLLPTQKRPLGAPVTYKKAMALIIKRGYEPATVYQLEMSEISGRIPQVRIAALYRAKKILFTILCPVYSQDTPKVIRSRMSAALKLLRVNFPLIPNT